VVVRDVEPPRLPIGVGLNELVRQVLLSGVFSHLDADPSDYSWIAGARLRFHPEKFPEEDPVRLDPKECFTKMDEDRGMENVVRVQIEVLNSVVPEEAIEEITSRVGDIPGGPLKQLGRPHLKPAKSQGQTRLA
jgi:hypothetical protein